MITSHERLILWRMKLWHYFFQALYPGVRNMGHSSQANKSVINYHTIHNRVILLCRSGHDLPLLKFEGIHVQTPGIPPIPLNIVESLTLCLHGRFTAWLSSIIREPYLLPTTDWFLVSVDITITHYYWESQAHAPLNNPLQFWSSYPGFWSAFYGIRGRVVWAVTYHS